jgi:GDP-D-mannose dehydratase
MSKHQALIVGATGIVNLNLGSHLIEEQGDWAVYGLARRPSLPPCSQEDVCWTNFLGEYQPHRIS